MSLQGARRSGLIDSRWCVHVTVKLQFRVDDKWRKRKQGASVWSLNTDLILNSWWRANRGIRKINFWSLTGSRPAEWHAEPEPFCWVVPTTVVPWCFSVDKHWWMKSLLFCSATLFSWSICKILFSGRATVLKKKKPTWRNVTSKDQLVSSWLRCWLIRVLPLRHHCSSSFSVFGHFFDQTDDAEETLTSVCVQVSSDERAAVWIIPSSSCDSSLSVSLISGILSSTDNYWLHIWAVWHEFMQIKLNTSVSASHTAIFGFKGRKPGRTLNIIKLI